MRLILLIVFGSAGTLARYGLQGLVQERTGPGFPYGTLIVNLIGCLLLGGITQYALAHLSVPPEWRIGITTGFLGAFTTFSTFTWETARLIQEGQWQRASVYVAISLIGGLLAVFCGMKIADSI